MMQPLSILAIPFLLILPGFFFLKFVAAEDKVKAALLSIPFSIPFTSVSAFALAEFHHFSLWNLILLNTLFLVLLFLLRFRIQNSTSPLPGTSFCLVLAGFIVAVFLYYSPPFEYFFGGRDPGIYVINGIRIAKTGGFTASDPLVKNILEEFRPLFFEKHNPVRYMGFQIRGTEFERIVPNFFYLYPVWLSIFFSLFGVHGMLYATPFLACCALWILALFARSLLGEFGATAALLILAANAIYLWFARFPNSEFLASYMVFAGIAGIYFYQNKGFLTYGILGAVCLGLSFYARVDAALLAIPFLMLFGIRWMDNTATKQDLWLIAACFLTIVAGIAHALNVNPEYLRQAFYNLRFNPYKVALILSSFCFLAAALFYLGKRYRITEQKGLGKALIVALAILLSYAYFIRPYYPASNIGSPNAGAFLALGWYFTHPVVLLALAGCVIYAAQFRKIQWIFFLSILIYGALYFYRIRADAEHFWMLRRYLMIICPAVAILSVYASRALLQKILSRTLAEKVVLFLSIALAGSYVYGNRNLHQHQEFRGSFAFLERLANRLGRDDLLLIGAKSANDLHIIGPMLSYYFDKNILPLRSISPDPNLLEKFIENWKGKVYFAGTGNSNLASARFYLKPIEEISFATPTFDELYHQRPTQVLSKEFQIGWYQILIQPPAHPDFVDVGKYDDGSITNFHLREGYAGIDYRWTDGKGHVFFPPDNKPVTGIVLRLNPGPWVPGMERVSVRVYANNLFLVDLKLRNGYNTYEVPVPAGIREKLTGAPVDIRIESKSWVPKRVLNLPDTRRVGVIVDWVKLQRGQ
jgi:hypothetical protein